LTYPADGLQGFGGGIVETGKLSKLQLEVSDKSFTTFILTIRFHSNPRTWIYSYLKTACARSSRLICFLVISIHVSSSFNGRLCTYKGVLYAGQHHQLLLGDGRRAGFFIGDGAGVGKGRQIAGVIMDNCARGRLKHVWFSTSTDLYLDARVC
jgi:hypothetical protein